MKSTNDFNFPTHQTAINCREKNPEADIKLRYRSVLELGFVVSISAIILMFFLFSGFQMSSTKIEVPQMIITVEDIPISKQNPKPKAPERPPVPVPSEDEDIPEDVDFDQTIDLPNVLPAPPAEMPGLSSDFMIIPDVQPQIIGGYNSINKNIIYPEMARKAGIECKVYLSVLVGINGSIEQVKILKSTSPNLGFEQAAIDAIQSTKWKPALQRDQPVQVWIAVPIQFKLK